MSNAVPISSNQVIFSETNVNKKTYYDNNIKNNNNNNYKKNSCFLKFLKKYLYCR